jgi:hypothetical protein
MLYVVLPITRHMVNNVQDNDQYEYIVSIAVLDLQLVLRCNYVILGGNKADWVPF